MCGIVGVWSSQAITDREDGERRLADMVSRIAHRGPDGSGVWFDGTVGLGHARLAVIDLSEAAAQPMVDVEGVVRVTYNGEIYNYRELRQQLVLVSRILPVAEWPVTVSPTSFSLPAPSIPMRIATRSRWINS